MPLRAMQGPVQRATLSLPDCPVASSASTDISRERMRFRSPTDDANAASPAHVVGQQSRESSQFVDRTVSLDRSSVLKTRSPPISEVIPALSPVFVYTLS